MKRFLLLCGYIFVSGVLLMAQNTNAITGSITISSEIAGEIIIDGHATGYTVKEGGDVFIPAVSTGLTEVAVRRADGTIVTAPDRVMVVRGQNVEMVIGRSVPEGLAHRIEGSSVTITGYSGNADIVNIPDRIQGLPVTSIDDWAFEGCDSLTSITIPSSVTSIGYGVFLDCTGLTSITVDSRNSAYASIDGILFDKNIQTIYTYPAGKSARTYIIPSSVTSIDYWAFEGCTSLTSITIPSSVTSIGHGAFSRCTNLTSVSIPSSVMSIGDVAFDRCSSLTSITIPSSVTSIGHGTFSGCSSLISVTIPSSVMSIDGEAFSSCISLTSIIIPSSVVSIGYLAFDECSSLTSVTIPSSVTSIGHEAFHGCTSLTSVTLSRRTQVGDYAFPETARIIYSD